MLALPATSITSNGIHRCDAFSLMSALAAGSVDAIITDMPYGTTTCAWDAVVDLPTWWRLCKRVIKPGGAIVTTASQPYTSVLVCSNLAMFRYEWMWEKSTPTGFLDANKRPLKAHENILIFCDVLPIYNPQKWNIDPIFIDRRKTLNLRSDHDTVYGEHRGSQRTADDGSRYPITVLHFATVRETNQHPTEKPVPLYEYLIRTYTNTDDLILDPFAGSGTTLVAAQNTGRRFIGCDITTKYVETARHRLETSTLPLPFFEAS